MDRFDLEAKIMDFTSFETHLNNLAEQIEHKRISREDTIKAIKGLSALMQVHSNSVFECFTQVFGLEG